MLPLLLLLEKGREAAGDAAATFLRGRSRRLWDMATRAAPAAALEFTLKTIRVQDERDPADSVAWCPAWQLAAAPRPWVRLLGLTSRTWPRQSGEDPILPGHIVRAQELDSDPPGEADRRVFRIIKALATSGIVFSRSRRNAQGSVAAPSPLLEPREDTRLLARVRLPEHALTESDRLGARPDEAAQTPLVKSASACWRDWQAKAVTPHDGLIRPGHPVLRRAIARVQSATSLSRLLRDPLGFVWRYALGWQAQPRKERPLTIPADEFGRLVHELLRRTVNALEPSPGFTVAHAHEIDAALADAVRVVTESWPIERPVPPHVLWVNTVRQAAEMCLPVLTQETAPEAGTRSWTEVPFGQVGRGDTSELPWNPTVPVAVPGTPITIRGSIDRLDLRGSGEVWVTDYKTGEQPENPEALVIDAGSELQRVLYALACRQLLDGSPPIIARLIYLRQKPAVFALADTDQTLEQVAKFVAAACALLEAGKTVPGMGAELATNELRLALPASHPVPINDGQWRLDSSYFRNKWLLFRDASGELKRFWRQK